MPMCDDAPQIPSFGQVASNLKLVDQAAGWVGWPGFVSNARCEVLLA